MAGRRWGGWFAAALAALAMMSAARADLLVVPGENERGRPVALLSQVYQSERELLLALGELAFKSTDIYSIAFACDSCHHDGGASTTMFFPGLSRGPGTIDISNRALTIFDDGIFNPLSIPSLHGARHTPPFGRTGRFETIREFTRFAIEEEFGGPPPSELLLDALTAFQQNLDFPVNPLLGDDGRLTAAAPAAALRGELLFHSPFPEMPGLNCAVCHPPAANFTDGTRHDVGTGDAFVTPSLRGVASTPPYMRDGRFRRLDQVVGHFDSLFSLGLSDSERDDLAAYLEAVGAGEPPAPPPPAPMLHVAAGADLLARAIEGRDRLLVSMVVRQIIREIDAPPPGVAAPPKDSRVLWTGALRRIDAALRSDGFAAAEAALDDYRALLPPSGAAAGG